MSYFRGAEGIMGTVLDRKQRKAYIALPAYLSACLFVYLIETVCSNRDTLVVKALNGGIAV